MHAGFQSPFKRLDAVGRVPEMWRVDEPQVETYVAQRITGQLLEVSSGLLLHPRKIADQSRGSVRCDVVERVHGSW